MDKFELGKTIRALLINNLDNDLEIIGMLEHKLKIFRNELAKFKEELDKQSK